ncbi:hypothetical protein H5J25_18580 [Sphingomonas aliaeris]|uniref:Uncharacterized protein n=1 Tax=Sphingomonas aliaeris TaxID=2759526 RepID=A0A974NUM7_9SPHN|nr:hypothetical protein [Sphingomonas aliaeris]QQV77281.1 hypothetical protein H5J25_18580 [Sphingomonas aliaeris]
MAFAASTVSVSQHGGLIPKGAWPAVRVAFSGTSGANTTGLTFSWLVSADSAIVVGDVVTAGALLNFNAMSGLIGLNVRANNPNAVGGTQLGVSSVGISPAAQVIAAPLDGPMLLEGDDTPATASQGAFFLSLGVYLPPNTAISGSIDLLTIFAERIGAIPAATA